ncbi:MAG: DUF6326 family protein [Marinilabiliaceae bacterium]|nr:DUF6326 family protein [Marinilabiliaceae bacterium]
MKKNFAGLSLLILLSATSFAQQSKFVSSFTLSPKRQYSEFTLNYRGYESSNSVFKTDFKKSVFDTEFVLAASMPCSMEKGTTSSNNVMLNKNDYSLFKNQDEMKMNLLPKSDDFFEKNRRIIYSSLWAFASLNYLYCDLVGLMDKNVLNQYQTGIVDGMEMTPQFLTLAGAYMQIALANVFLPHVIKNDKTLQWVQIASGLITTLVQSGTLFMGKPTPYYVLFSSFEIGTTAYITFDAIKWKRNSKKQLMQNSY